MFTDTQIVGVPWPSSTPLTAGEKLPTLPDPALPVELVMMLPEEGIPDAVSVAPPISVPLPSIPTLWGLAPGTEIVGGTTAGLTESVLAIPNPGRSSVFVNVDPPP